MSVPKSAQTLKDEGNRLFDKGDNSGASALYTEALSLCPEDDRNLRRVLHSNRSAARLRAGDADGALKDAEACMVLGPGWSKGFYRKGSALLALEKYAEAVIAFEGALLGEPLNLSYQESLSKAKAAVADIEFAKNLKAEYKPKESPLLAANGSNSTATKDDDPFAAFFDEVEEIAKGATAKVFLVDHDSETAGWTSTNQIERILQKHHKYLNLNPYHVFGLGHRANEEDIKKRYHKLSTLVHPDKNIQNPIARDAFEIVKKAYDELMNEERRALLLETFEICRDRVVQSRQKSLIALGNREDLLIAQEGTLDDAVDLEIKRVLALNERDRQRTEHIRAANEEAIARTIAAKQPNWAEVKREVDERKEGADERVKAWSQFAHNKRQKS